MESRKNDPAGHFDCSAAFVSLLSLLALTLAIERSCCLRVSKTGGWARLLNWVAHLLVRVGLLFIRRIGRRIWGRLLGVAGGGCIDPSFARLRRSGRL